MMAKGFQYFERDLKLATADLEPAVMQRALAAFARKSVAEVIAAKQAPEHYDRFVNGRHGAAEESVQLPGPIVYVFSDWKAIIEAALAELGKHAGRKTGRYARSFIVAVGGRQVTDFSSIAADAEVVIVNFQPYSRKMEVGGNGAAGERHFDLARGAIRRRFGAGFRTEVQFVSVSRGLHPEMPYLLKRGGRSRRKSQQAGQPITYPALILKAI